MKRTVLFIGALMGFARLYSQETIAWDSATKLTWADFRGRVDNSSPFSASTASGIVYKFRIDGEGYNDSITAVFYKTESWVRIRDEKDLIHEQGHFDITEIFARKLRKRLREFVPKRGSLGKQLKQVYDDVEREREATENLYDAETRHSADADRQAYWLGRIRDQLKELEEYGE